METANRTSITIESLVNAPIELVWKVWTDPSDIMQWCNASDDWHAPHSENDVRVGGKFSTTMAAKDGSMSFDFGGVYTNVKKHELMEYVLGDERKVKITFTKQDDGVKIVETFEAEDTHPIEMQRGGWQAILDNFKKYTESKK